MKLTAVQWLWDMLSKGEFINDPEELFNQAKALEKEQMEDIYIGHNQYNDEYETFEEYYNETFKSDEEYYNETFKSE